MLRHLILALFLIGLALPAMAAPAGTAPAASCHDRAPAGAPHHRPDNGGITASGHLCVGCVTPTALPSLLAPPALRPLAALAVTWQRSVGIAILPALPPPRP